MSLIRILPPLVICVASLPVMLQAAPPATYQNPVYAGNMPDPGALLHEGRYYVLGTTGHQRLKDGRVFRLLTSTDLLHWEELGGALEPFSTNQSIEYWAPEVAEHDGTFYLYYSAGTLDDLHFEIRVATSERPEGPYKDNGQPLQDGAGAQFFIDGHPYRDEDGSWYFFYAKDFLDEQDGARAGTGIVVDRLIDMTRLEGKPRVVVRPRYDWTLFEANRAMPMYGGRVFDWHTIEAPWVVRHEEKYYCFYSGSNFGTRNYGVDYVVADSVTGDYGRQGERARVLAGVDGVVRGPGHHSIVRAPAGAEMIIYHAWDPGMKHRQMCIDPLVWTDEGPRCAGPTVTPQTMPSGGE